MNTFLSHSAYALYLIGFSLVLFGVVEVGARVVGYGSDEAAIHPERFRKFQPDEELIWALRPAWTGVTTNGVAIETNALGFRGPEVRGERERPDLRVYFLGDSVIFGHFLEEHDSIPRQLERNLRQSTGRDIEVINGGVPGYSTFQEVAQFERWADELRPDLVLLGFCLNDLTERYLWLAEYGGSRFFMDVVDTTVHMDWLRRAWTLSGTRHLITSWTRSRAIEKDKFQVSGLWLEPDRPELEEAWATALGEIEDLVVATRRRGLPLAVVLFPYGPQFAAPDDHSDPQHRLGEALAAHDVPTLDLLQSARLRRIDRHKLYQDPSHFTRLGTHRVASDIATFLLDSSLVPAEEGG